jgi:hypothetical protein
MTSDDDLRDAFLLRADHSPDAASVHAALHGAIDRRRRRHQTAAVLSATVAVTGLALGIRALQPTAQDRPDPFGVASSPTSPVRPTIAPLPPTGQTVQQAVDAFFAGGYDYEDAVELATYWQSDNAYLAKALGGQVLRDGGQLPLQPGQLLGHDGPDAVAAATSTFFAQGRTTADGEVLAALWQVDPTTAKAVAGQQLRDGVALPLDHR